MARRSSRRTRSSSHRTRRWRRRPPRRRQPARSVAFDVRRSGPGLAPGPSLASAAKGPDAIIGFASGNDFVRVGPKVAATDQPFVALSSPPEGVRSGPSGGDNIFLVRPLDEQTDAGILDFVCTVLRKQLDLGDVRIALSAAPADSGANVVVSDDAPGPVGALVNRLRRDGVTIPFVGGATLGQAVEAGAIENLDNLWATDDCVPELERSKPAKRFVKAYRAEYGVSPSAAAARLYEAVHVVARVVGAVGHDHAKINKALRGADSDGVCRLVNDESNVMAPSVTVYRYAGPTDTTKVLVERVPLVPVPSEEPAATTTTTGAAG